MASRDESARRGASAHAIVVMAKAPVAGGVKSRLVPPLDPAEAAELNRCFLRDLTATIARATTDFAARTGTRADGFVAYTPRAAEAAFHGVTPVSFGMIAQRGDGLTARLIGVCEDLFAAGYASVTLMNSDSPTLPARIIIGALEALIRDGDRIALGGADDGGYCLIGLKRTHRRIFEGISWSTGVVYAQTLARATELALEAVALERWYDVDDAEALRRLCDELFVGEGEPRRGDPAPATRAYLERLLAAGLRARLDLAPD